jgi:murein L,D-transpeptidase YcbB/YkuD
MKLGHLIAVVLLGTAGGGALALQASAAGKDNWLTEQAFERAQGRVDQESPAANRRRADPFMEYLDEEFGSEPEVFTPGSQRRKRLHTFNPESFSDDEQAGEPEMFSPSEEDVAEFDEFDPEPDASIVNGAPKSPDDGFENYQPAKLVALSAPGLNAPLPADPLASTILNELRQPQNPVRVSEQQRDAIVNFYRLNNFKPLWVDASGLNGRAKPTLALLTKADEEGLHALDYMPPALQAAGTEASRDLASLAALEISLSAMALRYAEHVHSGRIAPSKMSGYYDLAPPALNLGQVLYELSSQSNPDAFLASLAPTHPAYRAMKAALAQMQSQAGHGDETPVPAGERVKVGKRDARVPIVRERMVKLGLLTEEDAMAWMLGHPADEVEDAGLLETALDKKLSAALKGFQAENGIENTGHIDKATVEALNSPSDQGSVQKIVLNMERLRWLPRDLGKRHILVNQAAYELSVVDGQDVLWSTKVIVGKPETQTYVFSDQMETVVLNPYWGVPKSILVHEMLPHLMDDPSYLDRKGFEVVNVKGQVVSSSDVDWWSYGEKIPFDVRQPPGDDNALGNIKFLFPNSHAIYMHDTPAKKLFDKPVRAFSHGCVRVEDPRKLAEFVLGWERQRIDDMIAEGTNQEIKLDTTLPVHLNYFTAWPDLTGKISFYRDVYKRDQRLEKALSTVAVAMN